jgi:hypothetical protein
MLVYVFVLRQGRHDNGAVAAAGVFSRVGACSSQPIWKPGECAHPITVFQVCSPRDSHVSVNKKQKRKKANRNNRCLMCVCCSGK